MQSKSFLSALFFGLAMLINAPAQAEPVVGENAPAFTATDSNGKSHNLSDFAGKVVVLEWTNDSCPFVVKHYESQNMQTLQKAATAEGVVWLSVISSAAGKQGHVSGERANELTQTRGAAPTAVLLDETGALGKLYAAKTTPHMFVIDAAGKLVYKGAIDSVSSADKADIAGATNYVSAALASLKAGTAIEVSETKAYGCSVKYAD